MKQKKRDIKLKKPEPPRYPRVVADDDSGKVVIYSRNAVSFIPSREPDEVEEVVQC